MSVRKHLKILLSPVTDVGINFSEKNQHNSWLSTINFFNCRLMVPDLTLEVEDKDRNVSSIFEGLIDIFPLTIEYLLRYLNRYASALR